MRQVWYRGGWLGLGLLAAAVSGCAPGVEGSEPGPSGGRAGDEAVSPGDGETREASQALEVSRIVAV